MANIIYSLLDEQMSLKDKNFFKQLGKIIARLRLEMGPRKIPASMLPKLAKLFAVPLEQLMGVEQLPAKRGPVSTLQQQIEQITLMPRAKQKFIIEMLDALIQQQRSA